MLSSLKLNHAVVSRPDKNHVIALHTLWSVRRGSAYGATPPFFRGTLGEGDFGEGDGDASGSVPRVIASYSDSPLTAAPWPSISVLHDSSSDSSELTKQYLPSTER